MRPPFAYFGGKQRMARQIVGMLPAHRVYVEPFFGSGAVLFEKQRSFQEVVNDREGLIVNFFRVLRDRPVELELACSLSPYARDEFEDCDPFEPGLDELERARRFWVRITQSHGQKLMGTSWSTASSPTVSQTRRMAGHLERFAPCAARLRLVDIENAGALEVIERHDAPDAAFYVDPPYHPDARTSFAGGRRPSGDYSREMTASDHDALIDRLQRCRGAVLLSGYRTPAYDAAFADWYRVERVVPLSSGAHGIDQQYRTEVIWSNRPIGQQLALALSDGSTL